MTLRSWTLGLAALGLALVLIVGERGRAPEAAAAPVPDDVGQPGVEPQGRGPVHEAYAEPGVAKVLPAPAVPKQPPEPVDEMPPDQKPEGDNVQWIPGYWAFDEDAQDFLWVSGCWRAVPPGRQWMPGHWTQVPTGWQWTAGFWAPVSQTETTLLPPPPDTIDSGPSAPAPQPQSVYVGGCWVYRTSKYVWRPGFWYTPGPEWIWVPARYVWTPAGCIFIEGYWDYPLGRRGVLFAPVVIERRCWARPRWVYRPRCVVYDAALLCSLFVRPACGCYYFGDYFEPRYRDRGFVAWVDFRIGRRCRDPLFTYCRWQYRGDRHWERDLRTVYVNRFSGTAPRPPRTFVQQTTIINNITVNKTVNVRNVTLLAPLSRVDRTVIRLQPAPRAFVTQQHQAAREIRAMSVERQRFTAQAVARGPAPVRPTDVPRVSRVNLPRPAASIRTGAAVRTPPLPGNLRGGERAQPRPRPVNPSPRPASRTEVQPTPRPAPRVEPKPAPRPARRVEPQPAPRPAPRVEPRPAPRVEPKPAPRVEPRPAPRPAPRVDPKPAPRVAPRPAPRPAPQPQPQPAPRPAPRVDPKPVPHPTGQSFSRPTPRVNPAPQPKPQPQPARVAPKPMSKAPAKSPARPAKVVRK